MTTANLPDSRSLERLRAHYDVEVELADRLRHAPKADRRDLYGRVYDELFARVPDHPQLVRREAPEQQAEYARAQVELNRSFLPPQGRFVEVGAGDCATLRGVAEFAGSAIAVEVSSDIVPSDLPPNASVAISDGVSVPIPNGSADLVYSNQLMEHLHPEDAMEQLGNIAAVLRPGGRYICITPNRLSGPHDISAAFDDEPRGFHLVEYTYAELIAAFEAAGFKRVSVLERPPASVIERIAAVAGRISSDWRRAVERFGNRAFTLPAAPYLVIERLAGTLPRNVARSRLFRRVLGINIVAER